MSEEMQERVDEIAEGCAELADIIKATAKCKVWETTEQDCLDMKWKFHCVGCTSPWPTARSLTGHERRCARAQQHFVANLGQGDRW